MTEYDPNQRCAEPTEEEASLLGSIEIHFAISCYVTIAQQKAIFKAVSAIIDAPCNQPTEGVHWLAEVGAKPSFSQTDQRVFNLPGSSDAPESGEPTFDDSILHMASCARGFVNEEERERKIKRREEDGLDSGDTFEVK